MFFATIVFKQALFVMVLPLWSRGLAAISPFWLGCLPIWQEALNFRANWMVKWTYWHVQLENSILKHWIYICNCRSAYYTYQVLCEVKTQCVQVYHIVQCLWSSSCSSCVFGLWSLHIKLYVKSKLSVFKCTILYSVFGLFVTDWCSCFALCSLRLQVGEVVTTIPTIGFNVEQVTYNNLKFQVWDLGGQTSIRWVGIAGGVTFRLLTCVWLLYFCMESNKFSSCRWHSLILNLITFAIYLFHPEHLYYSI